MCRKTSLKASRQRQLSDDSALAATVAFWPVTDLRLPIIVRSVGRISSMVAVRPFPDGGEGQLSSSISIFAGCRGC